MWLRKLVGGVCIKEGVRRMDNLGYIRCCICNKIISGEGNNAEPVRRGRCCDDCNWLYVIPARIGDVEMREVNNATQQR